MALSGEGEGEVEMEEQKVEKAKENEIEAQLRNIIPIVDIIARELSSHNFGYEARPTEEPRGTLVRYDV